MHAKSAVLDSLKATAQVMDLSNLERVTDGGSRKHRMFSVQTWSLSLVQRST